MTSGQDFGKNVDRRLALALDHGDIELALFLRVEFDFGFRDRGEPRAFQEPLHRRLRRADARAFLFFAQIRLARRQSGDMQGEPARRRKARRALEAKAALGERVGHEAL